MMKPRIIAALTVMTVSMIGGRVSGQTLQHRIDSLVSTKPATIGVAVKYGDEILCRVNADKAFPMMSVFKLHQAIAVIDSIGQDGLGQEIFVTSEMLRPKTYSPLRDEHPEGNFVLSIEDLLHYSLWLSDNNACDILFDRFGGVGFVADKISGLGLKHTQVKWTEYDMHRDTARCNDNCTTPEDAIAVLEYAFRNIWLRKCLAECRTGGKRIPALLPPEMVVGHKTGTGDTTPDGRLQGINDVGFVMLPDGTHFFVAVFCNNAEMTVSEAEAVIAEIALMSYSYITSRLRQWRQ